MNRRTFLGSTIAVAMEPLASARCAERREPVNINDVIEAVRKKFDLPGMAAAVVRDGQIVAQGVAGVREVGKPDLIRLDDRFAIGSCAKRMTVLLVIRLVDAGRLKFDSRLGDLLPGVKMRDEYRLVTVAQLLSFTGGIQPYEQIGPRITPILFEAGTATEVRRRFVEHVLNEPPIGKIGAARYSNASYVLAGAAAERAGGAPFEALMAEYVFRPLGMTRSGFGRPRNADRPTEPWQHVRRGDRYQPIPIRDMPAERVMAAPGGVHCPIGDFARFAAYKLAAARGNYALIQPATAVSAVKALGEERLADGDDFGGTPWLHAGLRVDSQKNVAVVVATNAGDSEDACIQALDAAASAAKNE